MANASTPTASTSTTTPSSAWSRLVQITRNASEGSRTKANGSLSQPDRTSSSQAHPPSSSYVRPVKRRRLTRSPPPRSATESFAPLSPDSNDTRTMTPQTSTNHTLRLSISEHDCITACPCRVEDVDCVASQQLQRETSPDSSRIDRQKSLTSDDFDHDVPQQKPRPQSCPSPAQNASKKTETLTHFEEQHRPRNPMHKTGTGSGEFRSKPYDSVVLEDDALLENSVSKTIQTSSTANLPVAAIGLQEGDQNSANKTPISKRNSSSPTSTHESIQLATPSSSPTVTPDIRADETQVDAAKPQRPAPASKTKRRLTLHSNSYDRQNSHKKRKTPPRRKDGVQTTLSLAIGSSAGMRECKLCDTVYNPFHPEDVKVHAKMHAVALKRERSSGEIAGVSESFLVE
ncbi:hypothetical protein diail_841 [Diaporthe ilicicola]|nr:hypothetical protein diail_841 [Diaporthe ilicicola]